VPTLVYVVRHGMTDWNAARRLAGRLPGISLNADGRREGEALAARLSALPLRAVVSSPMDRTRETAALIAERHGLSVTLDDAFVERGYAAWQGLFSSEIRERFSEDVEAVARGEDVAGVEPADAMAERVWTGLERWVAVHPNEAIAVVSHADPIRALLVRVLGIPAARLRVITIDTASVSRIRRRERATILDYANSHTHLASPGSLGWPPPGAASGV